MNESNLFVYFSLPQVGDLDLVMSESGTAGYFSPFVDWRMSQGVLYRACMHTVSSSCQEIVLKVGVLYHHFFKAGFVGFHPTQQTPESLMSRTLELETY